MLTSVVLAFYDSCFCLHIYAVCQYLIIFRSVAICLLVEVGVHSVQIAVHTVQTSDMEGTADLLTYKIQQTWDGKPLNHSTQVIH